VVKPGQQVKAGQLLGYSGVANGVAHLHYAVESGSPLDWVKGLPQKVANLVAGEDPGTKSQLGSTISTTSQAELQKAGCAGTVLLVIVSITGSLEIVKILLN
jgi:murein DD-endopeptidase MepM/ murein hydrolase activator NlpD